MDTGIRHIIQHNASIKDALSQLENLSPELILLVVDENQLLIGVLTDGDIRRTLTTGGFLDTPVSSAMNTHFQFINEDDFTVDQLVSIKEQEIGFVPLTDGHGHVKRLLNFKKQKSLLPVEAFIMAGGEGIRLRPLTEHTPKPLLPVGNKPILQHNLDLLASYGIPKAHISVNYLGKMIEDYLNSHIQILECEIVNETQPMGTMGSISLAGEIKKDTLLLMNSDLLTNIDLEKFYLHFLHQDADMAVATVPYHVEIPYGVLETGETFVNRIKEKPTYTYQANAGIYLIKKVMLNQLKKNVKTDAPTFLEELIAQGKKVVYYPILSYWLDIGKHEDYKKAQSDVNQIEW